MSIYFKIESETLKFNIIDDQNINFKVETNDTLVFNLISGSPNLPYKAAKFTTVERDALTPQNGDYIYNTTEEKFEWYEDSVWVQK